MLLVHKHQHDLMSPPTRTIVKEFDGEAGCVANHYCRISNEADRSIHSTVAYAGVLAGLKLDADSSRDSTRLAPIIL